MLDDELDIFPARDQVLLDQTPRHCPYELGGRAVAYINARPECAQSESSQRLLHVRDGRGSAASSRVAAKCVIVVLRDESRRALFDRMIMEGRYVTNPLKLEVNYTLATPPTGTRGKHERHVAQALSVM